MLCTRDGTSFHLKKWRFFIGKYWCTSIRVNFMFFKLFNHYIFRLLSCYIFFFNQTLYQMICNKKCRINSRWHRWSTSGILSSDKVGATTFFSWVGMLNGGILSISEEMVVTMNARTPGVSGDMSRKLWSWIMCYCDTTLPLLEKWTVYAL